MPVTKEEKAAFLQQLTSKERKTYQIAKEHLGSSFSLEKCIGFQKWLAEKKN
jgi:hypothetical protein